MYVPDEEVLGDKEDVSLVDKGDVHLDSAEEMKSNRREDEERKRVPDLGKGPHKRRIPIGHGTMSRDYPRVGLAVGPDPILRGRVMLDVVVLGPLYKDAIEGKVVKPVLYCQKFAC